MLSVAHLGSYCAPAGEIIRAHSVLARFMKDWCVCVCVCVCVGVCVCVCVY